MATFDDNLPLQRSYVEQRIGQLVGIFQIDRSKLAEKSEARTLPAQDGMVGLVAVADGGRLSETAFNAWTIGSQMFKEAGCPTSQRVDFNLSEYARRLWGANGKSGSLRRRLATAITELLKTRVIVMGVDPYTLEPAEGATCARLPARDRPARQRPHRPPRRGACEHPPWRAFLPAITGIGLHQPGRYAAYFLKPIHNIWVYLLTGLTAGT